MNAPQPAFNLMDPAFVRDPYPAYAMLRARAPVWKSPMGVWVLTRYDDIAKLLKDQRFVHDFDGAISDPRNRGALREEPVYKQLGRSMLLRDPPDHTRLRGLVAKAFTARRVEEMRPQIEKIVARGDVIVNGEENQTTKSDELVYDVAAQKVTVTGNVVINSDEDQTTTSDWAIYDVAGRKAVVGGNVILSQGENVLKGDRLHINLATGESRFENTGTTPDGSRRIRALLLPKDEDGIPGRGKKKKDAAQSP